MGEFFRGRRRKVGLLMLAMALLAMAGWVRSLAVRDDLMVSTGKESTAYLSSSNQSFAYVSLYLENDESEWKLPVWKSFSRREPNQLDLLRAVGGTRKWDWCGFVLCMIFPSDNPSGETERNGLTILAVPYCAVVLPLALISLWLLLTKPHKSTQKKNDEPTANEEA